MSGFQTSTVVRFKRYIYDYVCTFILLSAVGSCFEELAEGEEFDVYDKYAQAILSPECRLTLEGLLGRSDVGEKLASSGRGFREAVKFYLPKLLLGPVYHCFNYFKYIEVWVTF